jgi:hypothetical protein
MARLWDWRSGKLVCPEMVHPRREVFGLGFTTDGAWLLTGAIDILQVWETQTAKPVAPAYPIDGRATQILVVSGGKRAIVPAWGDWVYGVSLEHLTGSPLSELDADSLRMLGEILSGQRVHSSGGVQNLRTEEWYERWKAFCGEHPDFALFQ